MRPAAGRLARRVSRSLIHALSGALACVAALTVPAVAQTPPPLRWDGQFDLVSGYHVPYVPIYPGFATTRHSSHAISADGRWVVYTTTDMDGFGPPGVLLLDRRTGERTRVADGLTLHAAISADGNHVTWDVCVENVETGVSCDVRALDRRTGTETWLSATPVGTITPGTGRASGAVLSGTGRFVVFTADETEVTGDPAGRRHIVLRDRDPDADGIYDEPGAELLETISVAPGGFGDDESATPVVSDDGRFVAFRSLAGNLVADDVAGSWDVFLRDRQSGETRRLNVRTDGSPSLAPIDEPHLSMSADGRFVAFSSVDGFLAPSANDDSNGVRDVFVYDRQTLGLFRVDVGVAAGTPRLGDAPTGWATLSADGRYVVVQSAARNVAAPPPAGTVQVYVVDRATAAATRISILPDGTNPDASSVEPTISGDGSVVVFASPATNYVAFDFPTEAPYQLFAAAHLSLDVADVRIAAGGGSVPVTVSAQQHTRWWLTWDREVTWFGWILGVDGPGDGTMQLASFEPNLTTSPRTVDVRIGARLVRVTQEAGLSLAAVSPSQGPLAGGTTVTLQGTGFEPGMSVRFNGATAAVQSLTATTIVVTAPPRGTSPQVADVSVHAGDGRIAMLAAAFTYTGDNTPPLLYGTLTGPMGLNGWFVGPVTTTWTMSDPESTISSTTCSNVTVYSDTAGLTRSCSATSLGGTTSASVWFRRDTVAPVITVTSPIHGDVVAAGAIVPGTYTCSDTLSGVGTCGSGTPSGTPVDTATIGLKTFTTSAIDAAGNVQMVNIPYGVGTGVCSAAPTGMKSWLRLEGNLTDAADGLITASPFNMQAGYAAGEVGQGFNFPNRTWGGVDLNHGTRLRFSSRLSIAFWMRPTSPYLGTLVDLRGQLRVNYIYNDRLSWVMETPLQPTGWTSIAGESSGRAPVAAWTHVVLTFDSGELRLYLNGRLDTSWSGLQTSLLQPASFPTARLGEGPNGYVYTGRLDEVQFFDRSLGASEISGLYLAGTNGVCPPAATTIDSPPVTTTYGAGSFESTAILRDGSGTPMAGKTIAMRDVNTGRTADLTTDAAGTVRWSVPFTLSAGTYASAVRATFNGEPAYAASTAAASVTVQKATPVITWATPAPVTYGAPLGAAQLNATVNVAGTKTYIPAAGTVLDAGLQPLQVAFVPTSTQNYNSTSSTVTLEVRKALPTVTVTGGTFVYDGQPHAATASATGVGGVSLGPVTITYNGATEAPVAAGVYTVVATFAGDARHETRTATGTLTIDAATPVVTVPVGTVTYDGQPHAATAAVTGVGSEVPPGAVTITYDGSTTVPVGAGTYAVTATVAAAGNYRTASGTGTLTILKAPAVLSLQVVPATYDGQPHVAVATATGANGASLAPVTITYDGSSAVPVNGGVYAVEASFAGDANHLPASASATLVIAKAVPALAWNAPAPIIYGTPLSAVQLNATSSAPGTFAYLPQAGTMFVAGPAHPLTATFTPADPRNYEAGTVSTTIAVEQAVATVTVTGGTFTYDGQPHAATVSATGVGGEVLAPVTVTYNGSPAVPVGGGAYEAVATFAGDANHAPASANATITIGRAPAALSWTAPAVIAYGTPLSGAQLNATANVPGTFAYAPAAGTVLDAGPAQALTATFTPADPQNYEAGTVSTTIDVQQAAAIVTVTGGTFAYDGQPHGATATVTGVGGVSLGAPTLTYNGSAAVPVATGTYTVVASYAGGGNYGPASRTATLTIARGVPELSWAPPAPLPYGPTLGPTQLNAGASVPGTFSYSPGPASRLPAGTHTLSATFTPADPTNYAGGTITTSITIVPAPLEIRTIDATKAYGSSLPMFTASFTGLASGQTVANLSGTLAFATAATASSPVGTYAVTPGGLSSPNYAITFVSGTLTVTKAPVTVTLVASPTPSGLDMPITFTATVAFTQGPPMAPPGPVRFFDGATPLGTATLTNGIATLLTGGLTAGSHTIEARYDGDASFGAGTRTATHVVTTAAATPAITLTTSRQPASTSQSMTFTATITVATAGSIAFYDGGTLLGSSSIASGQATLTVASLSAGSHAITARFQGTASAPPVISPVFVQSITSGGWKDRTTTLTLASSANPSALGDAVTFTATASGSSGTPTGRILFMIDGLAVGDPAGVAIASGQASVSVSTFAGGRHKVTAAYLGNSNYRGSNGALTQTVN